MTTNSEPHDDCRMTPHEFRAAREALGLSAAKLAAELGVDPRTIRRWLSGDQPVPELVAKWVEKMLSDHRECVIQALKEKPHSRR